MATPGLAEVLPGKHWSISVQKLTPDGISVWRYIVRDSPDTYPYSSYTTGLAVDAQDQVFVCGAFGGKSDGTVTIDFDPGPGVDELIGRLRGPGFIIKLTADGEYHWVRSLEGYAPVAYPFTPQQLKFDRQGNLLVAGGIGYMTLAKFTGNGEPIWTRSFGNNSYNEVFALGVDLAGASYVMGGFRFTVDFDPGPGVDIHVANDPPGYKKLFVSKFYSDGSYGWTVSYDPGIYAAGMAVPPEGGFILTGLLGEKSADFDPTDFGADVRILTPSPNESDDFFVTKMNSNRSYAWTYTLGSPSGEGGGGIALDRNHDILVTGVFSRTTLDFDAGEGIAERTCSPGGCNFLLRLHPQGTFAAVNMLSKTFYASAYAQSVTTDFLGNIIFASEIYSNQDTDPTCGVDVHLYGGAIITKLTCEPRTGDIDDDEDVDLRDLAAFQNCFEGSDRDTCSPGCDAFDLRPDLALDLLDFSTVSPSVTGPNH